MVTADTLRQTMNMHSFQEALQYSRGPVVIAGFQVHYFTAKAINAPMDNYSPTVKTGRKREYIIRTNDLTGTVDNVLVLI